jgi:hypothetical protein
MTFSFHARASRRDILRVPAASRRATLSFGSHAQSAWPTKPVTMIVPFPAGGGTDAFARPLSAQFAKLTGKQLIIDNRGGAGGTLGASIAPRPSPTATRCSWARCTTPSRLRCTPSSTTTSRKILCRWP